MDTQGAADSDRGEIPVAHQGEGLPALEAEQTSNVLGCQQVGSLAPRQAVRNRAPILGLFASDPDLWGLKGGNSSSNSRHSAVGMMQTTQHGTSDNATNAWVGAGEGRLKGQAPMRSVVVVIARELAEDCR